MYNKKDLIARIAEKTGTPKTKAEETFNLVFDTMKELILDTNENGLDIYGIFKAEVVTQESRQVRNPKTGETFMSESKDVLKVKLSPKVKNLTF